MTAEWIAELDSMNTQQARLDFLRARPELHSAQAVDAIQLAVVNRALNDLEGAASLADSAALLAELANDEYARAIAERTRGHIAYSRSDYGKACEHYEAAIQAFDRLGHRADAARARNGALQTLIYLGRYELALDWAGSAREVLVESGDVLRAARCDLNAGNIYYRLDRYEEALASYRRAEQYFAVHGTPRDQAAAFSNIAVCLISMQDFDGALAVYEEGRAFCAKHDMRLWVAEADYNIAYLHFLRGNYASAMRLYQSARAHCDQAGDHYHKALCDLDEAEMYLELNLLREGEQLARRAHRGFAALHMDYERAKALTFRALAAMRLHRPRTALRLLERARVLFQQHGNEVWTACIDLYKAMLSGRPSAARRAIPVFRKAGMWNKVSLAKLVIARAALLEGNQERTRRLCLAVLRDLPASEFAGLRFEAHFLLGRTGVQDSIERAIELIESLRSRLTGDDLKTSFLQDKLSVYEHQIERLWQEGATPRSLFEWIEKAKSRGLAEMIQFGSNADATFRQWEAAQLSKVRSTARLDALSRRLASLPRETAPSAPSIDLTHTQASLPAETVLIEYFRTHRRWLVALVTATSVDVIALPDADVTHSLRLLRFHLAKYQLSDAVRTHLRHLYQTLIAPVRDRLIAKRLIIVPHGPLHHIPFHALWDGESWLIDHFPISYAPSASVHALCAAKPETRNTRSLAIGVHDLATPFVQSEVAAVASILPESKVLTGEQASFDAFRREAAISRIIHLASHGQFRHDNPMFSSVQLGDTSINLYDLYEMKLDADLVTLSGCSTGLSTVLGGDELVGLLRGLLHAGARSVLMSLWDVHDETTKNLMSAFYREWMQSGDKAEALRSAMLSVRSSHSHPYFWAPFLLAGESRGGYIFPLRCLPCISEAEISDRSSLGKEID